MSRTIALLLGVLAVLGCAGGGAPSMTPSSTPIEQASPTAPARPAVVLITPVTPTPVGQEVRVALEVHDAQQLYGVAMTLRHDPAQLSYLRHVAGDLLSREGAPTVMEVAPLEKAPGELLVGVSRVGEVGGISGSGTLITLVFQARQPGHAQVVVEATATLRDAEDRPLRVEVWKGIIVSIQ